MNKESLIGFENVVKKHWEKGNLPYLIHLCGGNEDELIDIFDGIKEEDYVFSTHRCHYHYLLKGGDPQKLLNSISKGDSMFVYDKSIHFLANSIVAGNCAIAVGVAMAIKMKGGSQKVWCFVGDGAEDEGHFYEAVRCVDGLDLPCTFIIEDNDRSVNATKKQRGVKPFIWPPCVMRYEYEPTYPHAGSGCTFKIAFK